MPDDPRLMAIRQLKDAYSRGEYVPARPTMPDEGLVNMLETMGPRDPNWWQHFRRSQNVEDMRTQEDIQGRRPQSPADATIQDLLDRNP